MLSNGTATLLVGLSCRGSRIRTYKGVGYIVPIHSGRFARAYAPARVELWC